MYHARPAKWYPTTTTLSAAARSNISLRVFTTSSLSASKLR
jgi:hypothetical protein